MRRCLFIDNLIIIISYFFLIIHAISPPLLVDPFRVIQEPLNVATKLVQPLQGLLFNGNDLHRGQPKDLKINERVVQLSDNKQGNETDKRSKEGFSLPSLFQITPLATMLGRPSGADLLAAESVIRMITSSAALPAFSSFAQLAASQMSTYRTPMFSSTPFGDADEQKQRTQDPSNDQSHRQHLKPSYILPSTIYGGASDGATPTSISQHPLSSSNPIVDSIIPFLPNAPLQFVAQNPDIPPPNNSLTLYSSALAQWKPSATTILLHHSSLPLTQAGAYKALMLWSVGISNAYGKIPTSSINEMTEEFVSSLLSNRYPFSPIVFASLALDTLSFVNTTRSLHCPPREAYDSEALGKMLFLRPSDFPEAFAKVLLDYFRLASIQFVTPSALKKSHHLHHQLLGNTTISANTTSNENDQQYNLPMLRIPTPSLNSLVQSTSAISSLFSRSPKHLENTTEEVLDFEENIIQFRSKFAIPQTSSEEAFEIIQYYQSMDGADFFLDERFKDPYHKTSLSLETLLKATEVSLGPIEQSFMNRYHFFNPSETQDQNRNNIVHSSVRELPPIANTQESDQPQQKQQDQHNSDRENEPEILKNFGLPFMSKSKKLRLQEMGLLPRPPQKQRTRSDHHQLLLD